ncbi:hypothetical protein P175DRAFT_0536458 [Aspergillus ochraceoroseus IBT 24754]|uniref:Uncharacterized protein n=1 Tax=Aspergillus ochraceoroseus IBT 24754 TaxID=1392256 RepID=A0A2T5LKR6_9EURO|nr:uncharacterized protein P175DRAFT_0536458 [Aspergillus ochraceoroseus IBT 24754]PTU16870.1 hypothetical protein P175DRAFT_0536458 [Aspergillus ochraceoroseus IBT 24754]
MPWYYNILVSSGEPGPRNITVNTEYLGKDLAWPFPSKLANGIIEIPETDEGKPISAALQGQGRDTTSGLGCAALSNGDGASCISAQVYAPFGLISAAYICCGNGWLSWLDALKQTDSR